MDVHPFALLLRQFWNERGNQPFALPTTVLVILIWETRILGRDNEESILLFKLQYLHGDVVRSAAFPRQPDQLTYCLFGIFVFYNA